MNRKPEHEEDPLWSLLRQSPTRRASGSFVDDTLRTARLAEAAAAESWWRKIRKPLGFGGLATAATAVVTLALMSHFASDPTPPAAPVAQDSPSLEALDEWVKTEALSVAAEDPSQFTDAELVSLMVY
jgi:hypothetical protein